MFYNITNVCLVAVFLFHYQFMQHALFFSDVSNLKDMFVFFAFSSFFQIPMSTFLKICIQVSPMTFAWSPRCTRNHHPDQHLRWRQQQELRAGREQSFVYDHHSLGGSASQLHLAERRGVSQELRDCLLLRAQGPGV